MKIRITGAKKNTYWYAGRIGEVFEVTGGSTDYSGGVLVLHDGSRDRFVVQLGDYETITEDSAPITVLPDESLGGIKREYREVKRKARVGDTAIIVGDTTCHGLATGDIVTVKHVYKDGGGTVYSEKAHKQREANPRDFSVLEPTEVLVIDGERFRMVDRKATKGERVIIVNTKTTASSGCGVMHMVGEIGTVTERSTLSRDRVRVHGWYILDGDYRVLEPIKSEEEIAPTPLSTRPATPLSSRSSAEQVAENIASLTAKVQTLESRVATLETLEAARKAAAVRSSPPTPESKRKVAGLLNERKSPQQIRDEIVERAKADVLELTRIGETQSANLPYASPLWDDFYRVEFVVNRNKRTVVALIRPKYGSEFRLSTGDFRTITGIAKCAPNDVFNVWIGKAIALRRALGLEVPAEYLTAPNPSEVRNGDIVRTCVGEFEVTCTAQFVTQQLRDREAEIIDDSREGADDSASSALNRLIA